MRLRRSAKRCSPSLSGQETVPGATIFNVFAATLTKMHDPVYAPIELDLDLDKRVGRVRVAGVIDTSVGPILNPADRGGTSRARRAPARIRVSRGRIREWRDPSGRPDQAGALDKPVCACLRDEHDDPGRGLTAIRPMSKLTLERALARDRWVVSGWPCAHRSTRLALAVARMGGDERQSIHGRHGYARHGHERTSGLPG